MRAKLYEVRRNLARLIAPLPQHHLVATIPQQQIPALSSETYELLIEVIKNSSLTSLRNLSEKLPLQSDGKDFDEWPGQHYRFLYELSKKIQPGLTIEIGTYRGSGALALAPNSKKLITYDIVPLNKIDDSYQGLESDFKNAEQRIGNLQELDYWKQEKIEFSKADLVFIDGPKNYFFEKEIIPKVISTMRKGSFLVLDDIRFHNMSDIWSAIDKPRIDIGNFAHFSGTGFIEI